MLRNKFKSETIRIAIFLATLTVVIRHGQNLHLYYPDGSHRMPVSDFNIFIQEMISRFTDFAIPFFFMISGFLFFTGLKCFQDLRRKLLRRIDSLLIPYFLWNAGLITAAFLLVNVPVLEGLIMRKYGLIFDWVWALKQITADPIVGQFWYIRTLILLCCLTPVFLLLYRSYSLSFISLVILMFFWIPVDCSLLSTEGLFCFFLGGFTGYYQLQNGLFFKKIFWFFPVLILFLTAGEMFHWIHHNYWYLRIFLSIFFLINISMYLSGTKKVGKKLCLLGESSFFIFAVHEILLSGLSIMCSSIFPHTPWISFLMFFGCIVLTVVAAVIVSTLLRRTIPELYYVLTGGR